MNNLSVVPQAQLAHPVATVLGNRSTGIAIGGKIRGGIKELTSAAKQHAKAKSVYEAGVAAGKDFDTIEGEIKAAVPELKNPLKPVNVPYFTVRGCDFPMPELAKIILDKYGEDRGDGVKRLYRFPVIFPVDSWLDVMPHTLKCYGSSQLKYWAEYSPDGQTRRCMTYAPVPKGLRTFGGRKIVTRAENEGLCDPEKCKEYQGRQCNLTGNLIFFIPGVPSINAISLPTNSFYSMNSIRQKLEMVGFMRGGRISGYLHGQETFWVTKKLHDVSRIDEDGKPTRSQQWLIELEANVDVSGLLLADTQEVPLLAQAEEAAHVLAGQGVMIDGDAGPTVTGSAKPEAEKGQGATQTPKEQLANLRTEVFDLLQAGDIDPEVYSQYAKSTFKDDGWSKSLECLASARAHLQEIVPMRQEARTLMIGMNIDMEMHKRYAKQRLRRPDWDLAPDSLKAVIAELKDHESEPDKLMSIIENELEVI